MKKAFVTLLSSISYVPGVMVLYKSLEKYGKTSYPFICVCSKNIKETDVLPLKKIGIECLMLERSALDGIACTCNQGFERWNFTFDKLLLWGLTEYETLVFLDSDMIVLDNIDGLFNKPGFTAVAAGHLLHSDWTRLNSGLVVIKPENSICDKLLLQIPDTIKAYSNRKQSVGDQDVINDVLPNWSKQFDLHLHEGYNMFFKNLTLYRRKYGYKVGKEIKIVHFIGNRKPWHDKGLKRFKVVLACVIKNSYGLKVYYLYANLLDKCLKKDL